MKRFVCVLLCVFTVVSACFVPASASGKKNDNPVILVSGFLCSMLYVDYGTENEMNIWKAISKRAFDLIEDEISTVTGAIAQFVIGKDEKFGEVLGEYAQDALELFRCNPDGSSAYELSYYPNNPATSNLEYMYKNGLEDRLYEKKFCRYLSEQTDPSRVYCFQYDSRLDAVTVANQLRDFINEVKAYNNAEKVNIFALSFGGLITSTYLTLFENDNSVEKVVMSVPAIGGTDIPDRLFRGDLNLPVEEMIKFFEIIMGSESNFARFFENVESERLNTVLSVVSEGFRNSLLCWGSIWSLCSSDLYENLKNDYLDPVANAKIINNNDLLHYEIKPKFAEVYKRVISNGGSVSIICATGSELVAGGEYNGDFILPAEKVSGAVCAPYGMRFNDGYTGIRTSCSNLSHNHVSPSMQIDASGAYLPENTWFVDGQYHGQYFYDEHTRSLITKLLFTDEIKDVHSSYDYPQFEYSDNPYCNLHVRFNTNRTGYLSADDTALEIKNISEDNYIRILSVKANGIDIDFDLSGSGILSPDETASVRFSGNIPDTGATPAQIKICYFEFGSITPFCVTDFGFTVNNGTVSENRNGFVAVDYEDDFRNSVSESFYNFLVKTSLRQFAECIYNLFN